MPSASRGERRLALKALEAFPVVVKTLPALEEIASGNVQVSDLRPIDVEDLLGRDPVVPNLELLTANVRGKVVMITGAGGSIGSELTRQLLKLGPKSLVLFELSEVALYDISMELDDLKRRLQKETERPDLHRDLGRRGARLGARPQARGAHHSGARRRGDLPRRRLQACPDRRGQPVRRLAEQHVRDSGRRRSRQGIRGRALRAGVERQGGAADQYHGREQTPRRADPPGAGAGARHGHHLHHGAVRQCARIPRARWSGCSGVRSRPAGR